VARFYAPDLEPSDETVTLPDDEAQHLVRVLRLSRGAEVRAFNGRGYQCRAVVELADKRGVVLRTLEPDAPSAELPFRVTLAQSVLKGDGMDDLVRDAVMLGVTSVRPLLTQHVDVSPARTHRVERWQRIAVSATKQCGRATVAGVAEPSALDALLQDTQDDRRLMLVEPRLAAGARRLRDLAGSPTPVALTVIAGPEGGWAPEERQAAEASGVILVTLGDRVLRADAVALVALPVLLYVFGALD
jgi:16S rRNA (uracil1498-N3)-methyltransferase